MLRRVLILLIVLALSACETPGVGGAPATPSPTPLSPTKTPSATASPAPSATPTLTPFPTLSGNKPYLMVREDEDSQAFSIYDTTGGRKIIELPPDGYTHAYRLSKSISPDGKWLVFYTGDFVYRDVPEHLPITLKLLNIADGTVKTVADVVTDGYAEKLNQVAEKLKKREPDFYNSDIEADQVSQSVIYAFQRSIDSVAWSPDGRTLAFAAQLNEISSDIYVYDLETGAIQQVEESLQSVLYIRWSPDGKYIVFENNHASLIYTGSSLHAVKPGKQVIEEPQTLYSGPWMSVENWFSQNTLLVSDGSDTAGNFNLHLLNIETGQVKTLWKGSIGAYAIDYKNKMIAINTGEFRESDWGLYFVTFDGKQKKIFDGIYYATLFSRDGEKHRFVATGMSGDNMSSNIKVSYSMFGVVGLTLDGKPTVLDDSGPEQKISISPDYTWLLIYDKEKLKLYDKNDELQKTFPISGIRRVIWWPDSQGIFYGTDKDIYTLSLPDGAPKWVDSFYLPDAYYGDLDTVWLP